MMRSFLKRKFPGDDWRNGFLTAGSDEVDLNERVVGNDLPNESHNIVEKSPSNMHAPLSDVKKALIEKSDRANQGSEELTLPEKQITTHELHPSFYARTKEDCNGLSLPHMVSKVYTKRKNTDNWNFAPGKAHQRYLFCTSPNKPKLYGELFWNK